MTSTAVGTPNTPGSSDGPALSSTMTMPQGVAFAPNGDVYWADDNCRIRKLAGADNNVYTITGTDCGYAEGAASAAQLGHIRGIAVAPNGEQRAHPLANLH